MTSSPLDAGALIERAICITGGTGSFGQAFTEYLLSATPWRIRILSRDEHKQEMMERALLYHSARLSFLLGDVRDRDRLEVAFDGASMVIHAAALKRVPHGERHASEFYRTNSEGTLNVARAAIERNVKFSLFISSDKAVQAATTYGRTKAVAESIWLGANTLGVSRGSAFAVVRGGNVWGSRGSVMQTWKESGLVSVTDPDATRFHLPMAEWTAFCLRALLEMRGGEIFIPKLRAWRLGDLADIALGRIGTLTLSGLRSGEKLHESLIAPEEIARTVDAGWCYIIQPPQDLRAVWQYQGQAGTPVPADLIYTSVGVERLTKAELESLWASL